MIVEYETLKKIQVDSDSDFEVDDEVIEEEEYLKMVDVTDQ